MKIFNNNAYGLDAAPAVSGRLTPPEAGLLGLARPTRPARLPRPYRYVVCHFWRSDFWNPGQLARKRYTPPETETGASPTPPAKNGNGRGIGSLLRASRLRCGEGLADIAQILRIRLPYLEAIEEGRFGDLPGNTYAVGFIRAYADHLGLDSGEVVRRYKEDVADSDKKSDLDFPVPVPESGIPGGAVLFIGVAIAILAYGGWYASTTKSGFFAELISPVPKSLDTLSSETEKQLAEKKESPQATEKNNFAPPQSPDEQSADATVATVATVADAAEGAKTENAPLTAAEPEPEKTAPSPVPEAKTDAVTAETATTAAPNAPNAPAAPDAPNAMEDAAPAAPVTSAPVAASVTPPTPPTPQAASTQTQTAPPPTHSEQASAAPAAPHPPEVANEGESVKKVKAEAQRVVEKPSPKVVSVSIAAARAMKSGSDAGRIVVRAKANSWIQIRDDIGNQLVMTRLLRSGDSYRVPDRPGLKLLTGNAGALEVLVDGKVVPAIGGEGAVRRSVMLDVDRLLQGTAVVE